MAHKIHICSNDETVCDGYCDSDDYAVVGAAYQKAASDVIIGARSGGADVDYDFDGNFQAWNGGWMANAGKCFKGKIYGYRRGLVATHSVNPPQWLRELIDSADEAGSNARQESVAECEAAMAKLDDEE